MSITGGPDDEQTTVWQLAARGELSVVSCADLYLNPLRAELYALIASLVYERLTRPAALYRGHHMCASGITRMEPECHDRHQDDVEAVFQDVLEHADRRIENLEGWIVTRLKPATIDAHRRRRGERGAVQRPRLPNWLYAGLDGDRWLTGLAIGILEWVGVPATVSEGGWPLGAWAAERAQLRNDPHPNEGAVAADIKIVLKAMQARPRWFEDYVERPLGRKQAPLVPDPDAGRPLVIPQDGDAALLSHAENIVRTIKERIERGDDARKTVVEVLEAAFIDSVANATLMNGPDADRRASRVATLLAGEEDAVQRLVEGVVDIVMRARPPA